MKTEIEPSSLPQRTEIQSAKPFSVRVFRNLLLTVLGILGALAIFLLLSGSFPNYYEPIEISTFPVALLLLFGAILWWRTNESRLFLDGKIDLHSSTVLSRVAYILFTLAVISKIVSFEPGSFSDPAKIVYLLLFLSIIADEIFKDFLSDKPILTLRYGIILAVGWYLNFTSEPVELMLLLAIAFVPMVLYESRFIQIGLPSFAFLTLFLHPTLGLSDTVLPGSIMIGSLAFLAAYIRGTLAQGEVVREANYAFSLYAEMLESTSDAVFSIDAQRKIERVNKGFEMLTGYRSDEAVGKSIVSFVYPDDADFLRASQPTDRETESKTYDARVVTKNGISRSVLVREVPLNKNGRFVGFQVIATDISERKQAEEALRASEERFHSLFDNATIGIYRTTPDGRILMVNPAVVRMLGYENFDELACRNLESAGFEPGYSRSEFRERLERDGVISGLESAWVRKDGSTIFVRESARAIKDAEGKVLYYDGTFEDITEQKAAEEALRLTRFTVERASDSVYWMNSDGQFIDVNEAACESLGYTREELLNLNVRDIDPRLNRDSWRMAWESLKNAGSHIHEVTHCTKDGRIFPAEIRFNYMKFSDRELVCAFGRDITERKRAEDASAHLAAIVDSSSDAIIGKGLNGNITSWNMGAQRTYGYTPAEALGRPISILAPTDYKDEIPQLIDRVKQGEEIAHYDTVRARKDGTLIDVSITLSPIKSPSGDITGVSTVARDVTENKRIERALRVSEEQNRAIINAVPDILFRVTKEGILLDFRAPDESALFLLPDAFLGKNIKDVMPSNVWKPAMNAIEKAIETDRIETFEYELPSKEGDARFYEDRVVRLSDREALSVIRDITERKQAEKALLESENKYRSLFTSSPETIFIIDPEGIIVDCNPAAETVSGKRRDELVGRQFKDLNFVFLGKPLIQIERAFYDILSRRYVAPFEIGVRRDDGKEFWFSLSASLLKRNGNIDAVQVIVSDITKRKRAEESLRQLNSFNEMLIKTLPFGISIVDGTGNLLFMSEKFKDTFHADMIGRKCWTVYKDDLKQCAGCPLSEGLEIGKSKTIETTGVLGGRTFQISYTGLMYNGKKALLEVFDDVTERKQLQVQFLQAQKMESLGTLASGIAHDFNNILGIILGHSSLIEEKLGQSDGLSKSFNAIVKAAERGASLVRQMLTFARKTNASFTSVSLNDSVKEIQRLFHEAFPKTMTLSCSLSPDLPHISGDSTQIHQALLNLCVNARDAMSGNGTLTIAAREVTGETVRARYRNATFSKYILLEVSDMGVGMDEVTRQHIFEPFFTTKEPGKGTGLGLSVVFGIMENHDGFIDVESHLGRGTTFYLYFPVKPIPVEANGENMSDRETSGGKETILVIEDEEMLRELAYEVLTSKGYNVITASDGEEGISVYERNQRNINLVLSDLGLPKLSGKDVLKKIKSINPTIKFVIATGFIDPEEKSDIFRNGASDIVPKPYTPKDLSQKVREVLDA
ncbi:MAG: PAS domain S-box protein [Bacteroidetes bacterium]|nr:PAS domain S-box protein [Bacteroidota bacterium]